MCVCVCEYAYHLSGGLGGLVQCSILAAHDDHAREDHSEQLDRHERQENGAARPRAEIH